MLAESHANASEHLKDVRPPEVDDRTLWLRFRNGNDLAFSLIYKKYVQKLFNYGMHICRDRDLVMDCLQELFARLWDKKNHLSDVEAVNYYLFKSFRRLLLNKIMESRKKSLQLFNADEQGFEVLASFEDAIILQEVTSAQIESLRTAIGTLTKRQREVIFLKFYHELSYQEVASIMEMGVDAVYNLMSKAIEALRKTLKRPYVYSLGAFVALFCA